MNFREVWMPLHVRVWFTHPIFEDLVSNTWQLELPSAQIMELFRSHLKHWNTHYFGNVWDRKKKYRACLDEIQKAKVLRNSDYLDNLKRGLLLEIDEVLEQEELLWR